MNEIRSFAENYTLLIGKSPGEENAVSRLEKAFEPLLEERANLQQEIEGMTANKARAEKILAQHGRL